MKNKVCFVVQRYGLEVNGGAELQCRLFAEHLAKLYDIDVVTTRAVDYLSWKNVYKNDIEIINGITVKRFRVAKERKPKEFNRINKKLLTKGLKPEEEIDWVEKEGPYCPEIIDYLKVNKDKYKAVVFFTYVYYPTVMGLPEVSDKAIFIPEAHNEPFMNMDIIRRLFYMPRAFFFNTEEERDLVHSKFSNKKIPFDIGGIGIDEPKDLDPEGFKRKFGVENYAVYVGRIDEGKNCHILFQYFNEYKKRNNNDLKLVLIGKPVIEVPKESSIISLGFLDDKDKINGIAGARMLILPSEYESLSMVVLEAMCVKTPVILNGRCNVLKGHCLKSNGALYYKNYFEFEAEINYVLEHDKEVTAMVNNAKYYVDNNYKWKAIVDKLSALIERI